MLFVVNPFDCIHTGYMGTYLAFSDNCYVLDTDDLVVESVSVQRLHDYLECGIKVENAILGVGGEVSVEFEIPFTEYIKSIRGTNILCLGNKISVSLGSFFLLNGAEYEIWKRRGINGIELYLNTNRIITYGVTEMIVSCGIAYMYVHNENIIVRHILTSKNWRFLTTLILSMSGELLAVLSNNDDIAMNKFECTIPLYVSKFTSLLERRY